MIIMMMIIIIIIIIIMVIIIIMIIIIMKGLRLKKSAQIGNTSESFWERWSEILPNAEHNLVQTLLEEYKLAEQSLQMDFWNMMMSLLSQVKDLDFINETITVVHDNVLLVGDSTRVTRHKKMRMLTGGNYDVNLEHDFRKDFNFLADIESFRDVFYDTDESETVSDTENVEKIIRAPAMVEHDENAHNTQTEELDLMEINGMLLMGEEEVITRTTTPIRTFGEATNGQNSRTEALDAVGEVEQPNSVTTDNNDRVTGRFVSDQVINLSNRVLREAEISVLSKGLKFVVTPKELDY